MDSVKSGIFGIALAVVAIGQFYVAAYCLTTNFFVL